MKSVKKICCVSSSGGHHEQLMKILQLSKNIRNAVIVSTGNISRTDSCEKYRIGECNRNHPILVLAVILQCLKIIVKERPYIVISTGAAPGLLFCVIAKVFGAKIIWIDSIANTEKLSLSGRIILPIANLILTQWEDVARKYGKVEYAGSVF